MENSRFATTVLDEEPQTLKPVGHGKSGAYHAKYKNGFKAIVKFRKKEHKGKKDQRGIQFSEHPKREVAYYSLAKLFGWGDLVPETLLTTIDDKECSVQQFFPALPIRDIQPKLATMKDEAAWIRRLKTTCRKAPRADWTKLVVLDLVAAQRDRHANNVGLLVDVTGKKLGYRVLAWDNAVSFGLTFKHYHNVFHKVLFTSALDLDVYWDMMEGLTRVQFQEALGSYLTGLEIEHAFQRLRFMLEFPYKLPWKWLSGGPERDKHFPHYEEFFQPLRAPNLAESLFVAVG